MVHTKVVFEEGWSFIRGRKQCKPKHVSSGIVVRGGLLYTVSMIIMKMIIGLYLKCTKWNMRYMYTSLIDKNFTDPNYRRLWIMTGSEKSYTMEKIFLFIQRNIQIFILHTKQPRDMFEVFSAVAFCTVPFSDPVTNNGVCSRTLTLHTLSQKVVCGMCCPWNFVHWFTTKE